MYPKHEHHNTPSVEDQLRHIERTLGLIIEGINYMSQELDNLTAQVKANNDLLDSATTLINGIADRITAAGVDSTKLAALASELKAKDDVLSTALIANTPQASVDPTQNPVTPFTNNSRTNVNR